VLRCWVAYGPNSLSARGLTSRIGWTKAGASVVALAPPGEDIDAAAHEALAHYVTHDAQGRARTIEAE
jgi:hypothetical protein